MISYYKTVDTALTEISAPEPGCWISVSEPTEAELMMLIEEFGLDRDFLRSSLDEEESSRVEREEGQTLIIVDTAVVEKQEGTLSCYTVPLGIITTADYVFTISAKQNAVIQAVEHGAIRNLQTRQKTRFVLLLLLRITAGYVAYLKLIDRESQDIEKQLQGAMKNEELVQLLALEKSLVYFSNSLKANNITIEKILRGRVVKLYEEDTDLLEDVLIEVKQAIEMTKIYTGILSVMVDAFGAVIANNQNKVMWRLTAITLIITVPTMVYSFYGMNTSYLPFADSWFPMALSVVLTAAVALPLLWDRDRHRG